MNLSCKTPKASFPIIMAETFKCPSCSAPLEFEGKPMQKCAFCQSNVIVPSGVMENSNAFGGAGSLNFSDLSSLTGKALKIGEIQKLLQNGNKIGAIKVFRETFGVGLKEAKDAVEAMERGESVDVSGMQIHTAHFRPNAQPIQVSKRIGTIIGGSILGTFLITGLLIVGIVAAAFYIISRSVNRAVDETKRNIAFPNIQIPQFPQDKNGETSTIAQEILKFGGEGVGAGKFKDNRTVTTDTQGKIFSADFSGGRIQVFDANGNFQTQVTADTTKTVDALGTDRKGNLFVLQGYELHRFKAENGEVLSKTRVDYASDMAIGLDGKIYVSTRRGEIQVFDAEGTKLKTIQIGKDLNLEYITQIAVDGTGNLFALDGKNYAVFKLSPDGKLLTRFGGRSTESSDKMPKAMFSGSPYDLTVDSQGRLYVSQVSRISIFDGQGNYLNDFKTTQAFGMAFNDADELFVASRPFVVKYKLSF